MFKEDLKKAMLLKDVSQAELCKITGIGKSSISQYLSGKVEPPETRKSAIAQVLGLEADYFTTNATKLTLKDCRVPRLKPEEVAKILGISKESVRSGLREGVFPWGYAIKGKGKIWTYYINANKFAEIEGIAL